MGHTITEKILARAGSYDAVYPGQVIKVNVDFAYMHDESGPNVLKEYTKLSKARIWHPAKVAVVFDHHSSSSSIKGVQHHQNLRSFVRENSITKLFDVGRGVCHSVIAEESLVQPGQVVVGTASHTVGLGAFGCFATGIGETEMAGVLCTGRCWFKVPQTLKIELKGNLSPGVSIKDISLHLLKNFGTYLLNYMALEFCGPLIEKLSIWERMVLTIMATEMGVKSAVINPDQNTLNYYSIQKINKIKPLSSDENALYSGNFSFDISNLEPIVAIPGLISKGVSIKEVEGMKVHQATIGSCSGAFLHDIKEAVAILKGRKVHPEVRFYVVPNSSQVMLEALNLGLIKVLVEAGAIFHSPGCGTCAACEVGYLAPGETCIASTTRNINGRMGPGGKIFLSSSATVAASAVMGQICDPRTLIKS